MSMCKCNERYIKLAHAIGEYEGIVSSLEFDLKEKDLVVVTGGFTENMYETHTTNLMKIVEVK